MKAVANRNITASKKYKILKSEIVELGRTVESADAVEIILKNETSFFISTGIANRYFTKINN